MPHVSEPSVIPDFYHRKHWCLQGEEPLQVEVEEAREAGRGGGVPALTSNGLPFPNALFSCLHSFVETSNQKAPGTCLFSLSHVTFLCFHIGLQILIQLLLNMCLLHGANTPCYNHFRMDAKVAF